MSEKDLGRVIPMYKGEYSGKSTYELNDIVKYGNALYWHFSDEQTSGESPADETVWACVIQSTDGEGGYTPVKGVDYFTDADKAEIIEEAEQELTNTFASKDELARKLDANELKDIFVDEVKVSTSRAYDTDIYIAEIPYEDAEGNVIQPTVVFDASTTPLEYAAEHATTLTTNAQAAMRLVGSSDYVVSNTYNQGEKIYSGDIDAASIVPNKALYILIGEDREVTDLPIETTAAELEANDVYTAFACYYKLVENGEALDLSDVIANETDRVTAPNPNLALGVKANKTIVMVATDGRTDINAGLTSDEMASFMVEQGCVSAYMLDGGGSTSMSYKGSKLNRNIDDAGTTDRKIRFKFNISKELPDDSVAAEVFGKIGAEKQRIIQQIIPYINEVADNAMRKPITDASASFSKVVPKYMVAAIINSIGGKSEVVSGELVNYSSENVHYANGAETYDFDTSALSDKYFPDGMKSAGNVYDELDFKRMVAVQRVGAYTFDGTETSKVALQTETGDHVFNTTVVQGSIKPSTRNIVAENYVWGNVYVGGTFNDMEMFVTTGGGIRFNNESCAEKTEFLTAIAGETIYYELAEPIETPITETVNAIVEVEAGGTITFENDQNESVAVPNSVTFYAQDSPNAGTPGADGITPHIGANGNWFIGDTDTGNPSRGLPGADGANGQDGYTPVKGTDYWTAADQQSIVNEVDRKTGNSKRKIENFEAIAEGLLFREETVEGTDYIKTITDDVAPWATIDSIGGKSLVFNQLVKNGDFVTTENWQPSIVGGVISASNNELTFTSDSGTASRNILQSGFFIPVGHKVFYSLKAKRSEEGNDFRFGISSNLTVSMSIGVEYSIYKGIMDVTNGAYKGLYMYPWGVSQSTLEEGETFNIRDFVVFDLTLMFGAGNEPSTVEEFEAMFPDDYYPYNEGEIISAEVDKVVSRNAGDEVIYTYTIPEAVRNIEGYGWSAGDVYNEVDFERKKFIKRVGKVILDGTNKKAYSVLTIQEKQHALFDMGNGNLYHVSNNEVYVVCDKIVGKTANEEYLNGNGIATVNDRFIRFNNDEINNYTTATQVDAWLQDNPLTVFFVLAEPIEIDISSYLTEENVIDVEPNGTVTFEQDNGTQFEVPNSMTFVVDLGNYLAAEIEGKVAKAQGVSHSGEFLVVGADGNVTTQSLSVWQGGSY